MWFEKNENEKVVKIPFELPQDIGRFAVVTSLKEKNDTYTPFINCTGLFEDVNEGFGEREQQALKNGHCIDPKAASSMIKGTKEFKTDQDSMRKL